MKLTHRILIPAIALAALVSPPFTFAQDGPPPPPGNSIGVPGKDEGKTRGPDLEKRIARLKEILSLTPEQETQVREIFARQREQSKAQRQANKGNRPTKEEAQKLRKERRDKIDAAIRAVLTPEQQTKWDAHLAERKDRGDKLRKRNQIPESSAT